MLGDSLVRITIGAAGLALAAWIALVAWLFVQQRRLVYYPALTRVPASATDFAIERDGIVLRGWRVNGERPDAVVYFGGNAESLPPMRERLRALLPEHALYLVAYRGYGASDGVPSEDAIAADARALFDAVHASHRCGTISVIGRSLGAGVAARLASVRSVDRLVLVTPFDRLATVAQAHMPWAPVHWLLRERYDAARAVAGLRIPVLVAIAGRDAVVPHASSQGLIDALPRPPRVIGIADATHDDIVAAPQFGRALQAFIGPPTPGCAPADATPLPRSG